MLVTHGNTARPSLIVVLVNRDTASAAEIVSGALQDHDRAPHRGRNHFWQVPGADRLQPQRRTPGLALTTYHYYTPSGRLGSSAITQAFRSTTITSTQALGPAIHPAARSCLPILGRTVYGGGGITPDEKIEAPTTNRFQDELVYKDVFFHFAPAYVATHTVDKNFQVDDAVLGEFKKFLTSKDVGLGLDSDLNGVSDWVKAQIKKDIFTIQFWPAHRSAHHRRMGSDSAVALTYMPEAQALEDNAHKVLADKAQARFFNPGAPAQP